MGRINLSRELIDDGYSAQKCRSAYGYHDFCIRPPSLDTLEDDPTVLLTKSVQKKAGRPKGKWKRKHTNNVIGEYNTSPNITSVNRRRRERSM